MIIHIYVRYDRRNSVVNAIFRREPNQNVTGESLGTHSF